MGVVGSVVGIQGPQTPALGEVTQLVRQRWARAAGGDGNEPAGWIGNPGNKRRGRTGVLRTKGRSRPNGPEKEEGSPMSFWWGGTGRRENETAAGRRCTPFGGVSRH